MPSILLNHHSDPSPAPTDLNPEKNSFDLPPTSIAKALPAFQRPSKTPDATTSRKKADPKPAKNQNEAKLPAPVDDTPKSFARLMQFHTLGKRLPKGLDDGTTQPGKKNSKKRKIDTTDTPATQEVPPPVHTHPQTPRILPGERLADFAARVDQALPMTGLRGTDKQRAAKVPGVKERTTKHNKRLERMQKEWRAAETWRKEKREEEMDEWEEEREEQGVLWNGVGSSGKRRKGPKNRRVAEEGGAGDEEDPWKALEKSRADTKQRNLQDVVQAPPQLLKTVRRSTFKEVGGGGVGVDVGNVPGRVGSLRKREELGEARRTVIEGYRKRMGRGAHGVRAM